MNSRTTSTGREPTLTLSPGREKSLNKRHPWIFSGAIATVSGDPEPGATVLVRAASGTALGRAAFSPASQIRARMWTFDPDEAVDESFFARRFAGAVARRAPLVALTDAMRLVFGEADQLPGIVVDRYGSTLVLQANTAGAQLHKPTLTAVLTGLGVGSTVIERSDAVALRREGCESANGVLAGSLPSEMVEIRERSWTFLVDVSAGHKTGFYLDQRDARGCVESMAKGRRELNGFTYTGAFSVAAWTGGATSVTSIDSSAPALALAARNLERNGFSTAEIVQADAFADLRARRERGERYDLIILDPPKFASSEKEVQRATRAYKDLNLQAFHLLAEGGLLMTFSCSGAISEDLFVKVVAGAALDARRDGQIIGRLGQPLDHPVALHVPQTAYLKGLVCGV